MSLGVPEQSTDSIQVEIIHNKKQLVKLGSSLREDFRVKTKSLVIPIESMYGLNPHFLQQTHTSTTVWGLVVSWQFLTMDICRTKESPGQSQVSPRKTRRPTTIRCQLVCLSSKLDFFEHRGVFQFRITFCGV